MTRDAAGRAVGEAGDACCVAPGEVDDDQILADVAVLTAAANDTRYELLRRIEGADGSVCVCDLEAAVGVTQSAVSQGLSKLATAGLVTRRKDGAWRYYETTPVADELLATLSEVREG